MKPSDELAAATAMRPLGTPRPDLVEEYRAKLAATMPLGRPSDINIAWIADHVIGETVLQIVEAIHEAEDNLRLVPRW